MIGVIVFVSLFFLYNGFIKDNPECKKICIIAICAIAVIWLLYSFSDNDYDLNAADHEKIRIYEEKHKDDW